MKITITYSGKTKTLDAKKVVYTDNSVAYECENGWYVCERDYHPGGFELWGKNGNYLHLVDSLTENES